MTREAYDSVLLGLFRGHCVVITESAGSAGK